MAGRTRLLTADWIGIGLAVIGTIGSIFGIMSVSLIGLGVFGPSILRELGWLNDADEYTRTAMYRAGFHSAVLMAFYLTTDRVLANYHAMLPAPFGVHKLYFTLEHMMQMSWVVFAISYVVQYWGPRLGVSRVLLGVGGGVAAAGVQILIIPLFFPRAAAPDWTVVGSVFLAGLIPVALALFVRRKPRVGGYVLLGLLALALFGIAKMFAGLDSLPAHVQDQGMSWAFIQTAIASVVILGPLGLALIRDRDEAPV